MRNETIKLLISRYVAGEISDRGNRLLQNWLAESPQNRAYFEKVTRLWKQAKMPPPSVMPNKTEQWVRLESSLGLIAQPGEQKSRKSVWDLFLNLLPVPKPRPGYAALAAACAIALFFIFTKSLLKDPHQQEIVTANTERQEIILPDSSTIYLNSGSKLSFTKPFSDTLRHVTLSGEGFFEIVPGKIPFVVSAGNAQVRVLGTRFNVWSRELETRVVLKEGKIQFSSVNCDSGKVVLLPGQMSMLVADSLPRIPKTVNLSQKLAWLENKLVFDNTPLREVIAELQRIYDVTIKLSGPDLEMLPITATFEEQTIELVLSAICLTFDLNFELKNGKYILSKK